MIRSSGRIVLSYGCFDGFGVQHAEHLRRAAELGHELIIGCATESYVEQHGLICHSSFEHRKEMLRHCRFVDRVIPLVDVGQVRTDIVNHDVSVLAVGQDMCTKLSDLQDIAQIYQMPEIEAQNVFYRMTG